MALRYWLSGPRIIIGLVRPGISFCARDPWGWAGAAAIAQLLYLKSGRLLSESLVAPGSTICLSCTCKEL